MLCDIVNYTTLTTESNQTIHNSMVRMVMNERIALNFFPAGQGGVCAIL